MFYRSSHLVFRLGLLFPPLISAYVFENAYASWFLNPVSSPLKWGQWLKYSNKGLRPTKWANQIHFILKFLHQCKFRWNSIMIGSSLHHSPDSQMGRFRFLSEGQKCIVEQGWSGKHQTGDTDKSFYILTSFISQFLWLKLKI